MVVYRAVGSHKSNIGRNPIDNNCNNTSRQGYVQRYAPQDTAIINPRFVIPSWLVFTGPAFAETDETYTWTNSYSIEYPVGSGVIYQITWNGGQPTITIPPGTANYTSDPLPLTIAAGAKYIIRDWGQAQDLRAPSATVTVTGGSLVSTAISDGGIGLNTTKPVFGSNSAPALTAAVPAGAGAGSGGAIACTVVGGVLTALPLTAGSGYTDGTYAIVFANGANVSRCPYHTTGDWAQHGTGLADLTLSTTTKANDQLGFNSPMLIEGQQGAIVPAVGLISDSILDGTADQTTDTSGWIGAFEKSMTNRHGHLEVTQSGETLSGYIARHSQQAMFLESVSHFVCGLVRNDIGAGASVIQGRLQTVWAPYIAAGIKVYQVTSLPTTTSTDGWATTVNQTASPFDAQRLVVNDWLRTNYVALGLTGIIDMCSIMESGLDTGLFNASAGGGSSQIPKLTIVNGVVTACSILSGVNYAASSDIPCEIFYPEGTQGSGLSITAHTDGSGNITSATVNNGGSGHIVNNAPLVAIPGTYTNDGVHPSTYGHFKMVKAGLFAPSKFTLATIDFTPVAGYASMAMRASKQRRGGGSQGYLPT